MARGRVHGAGVQARKRRCEEGGTEEGGEEGGREDRKEPREGRKDETV
jgi:hypothetical protein